MSFAAVRRGVQFPWEKKFGALDFLKDREQEGSLWGRGSFAICCRLFVLSWGDTPWIVHPPGGDHRCSCVSSWELQESHKRQRNVGNRAGVVLWGLSRFISSLEGHKQWTHTWFAEQINKPFNRLRFCGLIKQVLRIDALCGHLSIIPAKQMCEDYGRTSSCNLLFFELGNKLLGFFFPLVLLFCSLSLTTSIHRVN